MYDDCFFRGAVHQFVSRSRLGHMQIALQLLKKFNQVDLFISKRMNDYLINQANRILLTNHILLALVIT